jgi:putative colanic acid biosynthesis UDP-glucose lipid carrier transferase
MNRDAGLLRPHHPKLVLLTRSADAMWILATHYAVYVAYEHVHWGEQQTLATIAAVLGFAFAAETSGLYQRWRGVPLWREVLTVWLAWGMVATALLFAGFVLKTSASFSRVITGGWFVAAPLAISIWRALVRYVLYEARRRGHNTRRVAIVGMTEMGERVAERIQEMPSLGMMLSGFYDDRAEERCHRVSRELGRLVGSFEDLIACARAGQVDLVYVALPLRAEPRVNELVRRLADTTASVYFVPDFFAFDLLYGRWTSLDDIAVISIFETPFHGVEGWVKRLEDVLLGTIFLAFSAIPMALIAIVIKLTSPGPVFFRQRRYGLNGEVIDVLKFRSMSMAEDGDRVLQATRNDPRTTPFGAFLRRASLDELPQLFHVVSGKMSLVGPRPHAVAHNEEYRTRIHGYMLRHKVKPGLTGWAQVNGWRGETDTLEKMVKRVEHDLEYIRRWDLLFDLKIIALTVFGTKVRQNAY